MIDPTNDIMDAVQTLLSGNVSYNGNNYAVIRSRRETKSHRWVMLESFNDTDDSNDTTTKYEGILRLIIGAYFKHSGNAKAINSVATQVETLLAGTYLTMPNYYTVLPPDRVNSFEVDEMEGKEILRSKTIDYRINVQLK